MNEANISSEDENFPRLKSILKISKSSYSIEITSLKSSGTIPCCRSSFIGVLYNKSKLFIHGGTNEDLDLHDSYVLDLETLIWSSYLININYKLTLVGHSALMLRNDEKNQNNLLIFGGWDGSKYIDTCYLLNFENNSLKVSYNKGWNTSNSVKFKQNSSKTNLSNSKTWAGPKTLGSDIPSSRRDHTMTYDYINNKIYLFGGWNSINWGFEENEFNELWILDSDWRWSSDPTNGFVPPGRRGHTAIFLEECKAMIIYGELGVYGYNKILDDCYMLDLEKRKWTLIEYSSNDDFIPRGRAWHSACKIKEEIFYIGGMLKNQEFSNEIITFNIFTHKWKEIYIDESPNTIFKPRCSHITIHKENCLYIMGGLGKMEPKEDYNEKKEPNARNPESSSLGFSQIIKIKLIETNDYSFYDSEPYQKEEKDFILLSPKINNITSAELPSENSFLLQYHSDLVGENKTIEKNEHAQKKTHSLENFSDEINKRLKEGTKSNNEMNFDPKALSKMEKIIECGLMHNSKSIDSKNEKLMKSQLWNPERFPTEDFLKDSTKRIEEVEPDVINYFASKGITEKEIENRNETNLELKFH